MPLCLPSNHLNDTLRSCVQRTGLDPFNPVVYEVIVILSKLVLPTPRLTILANNKANLKAFQYVEHIGVLK